MGREGFFSWTFLETSLWEESWELKGRSVKTSEGLQLDRDAQNVTNLSEKSDFKQLKEAFASI